ncbi:hypothetical protein ZIOFF_028544 [Zingiber officinale]|uniref:Uncharacterized protein n=1 Tax=Zingiber officinale TaxID=94328 RepID=A0A8J5L3M6_ZINOF|nr:hypothetical protein ZIOFF_028544 [Zingiber officinale]
MLISLFKVSRLTFLHRLSSQIPNPSLGGVSSSSPSSSDPQGGTGGGRSNRRNLSVYRRNSTPSRYLYPLVEVAMDAIAPTTLLSREIAREFLIAISQTTPEKCLAANVLPANSTDVGVAEGRIDRDADKYRSKLISISQSQSPDAQPSEALIR